MKKLLPLLCLAVAGCATTAPSQYYRPAGAEEPLKITGHYNEFTYGVDIFINDEPALNGNLPLFGSDVELSGQYDGASVSAYCNRKYTAFSENINCLVFVGNERAATLTF